ncbi:MAG: GGDEF domain-containing protein [Minisyncoccia bacterium]
MNEDVEKLIVRIAELEAQVETLKKDLIHDPLTHLKTRNFFEEESKNYLKSIPPKIFNKRRWFGPKNVSFIFFDIDNFKKVNDKYGHSFGDIVLEAVSDAIRGNLRELDIPARWGGEEIVVTLVGATEEEAKNKAEDIRAHVENLVFEEEPDFKITISAGVASAEDELSLDEIVQRADKCLYKAKERGRNTVVAYSEL